jgi:hypothetical protein
VAEEWAEGQPYPPETIVVRGGLMFFETLDKNIRKHARRWPDDPPTLSVGAYPGWTAEEIMLTALFIENHHVRLSTVGEIRALRHDVVPFGRVPHCSLQLCAPGSDALYTDLCGAFSDPTRNVRFPV